MSKRALLVSDPGTPPVRPEPNAKAWSTLLQDKHGFAAKDVWIMDEPDLRSVDVMKAIEDWLVAGTRAGDVRVLAVSAHGGMKKVAGRWELMFGLPADHGQDYISDTRLEKAFKPLAAAGVFPWTCFEACLKREERLSGLAPALRSIWAETGIILKKDGWIPLANKLTGPNRPRLVVPDETRNSIILRGCQPNELCQYRQGWGGLFMRDLAWAAGKISGDSVTRVMELTMHTMHEWSEDQTPMLIAPSAMLDRPIFT